MWRWIPVDPPAVRALLAGTWAPPGDGWVHCGDILVGRVAAGRLAAVACPHVRHGVAPAYRAKVDHLIAAGALTRTTGPCPTCQDRGVVDPADPLVPMACALGVFRGIPLSGAP